MRAFSIRLLQPFQDGSYSLDSHWHNHRCLHHLGLLCHRTVSATIPSMEPIFRRLSTTEAMILEDSTAHASRAEYELSRTRSWSKSSRVSRFTTTKAYGRRSQRSQSQNAIARMEGSLCAKSNWIQATTQSAVHVACPINSGSNESEHMIIRKNVTWAVDYNER